MNSLIEAKKWTHGEIKALKLFFPNIELKTAIKEINKANPLIERNESSIRSKASSMGVKSYKYKLKQKQILLATEEIKKGRTDFKKIAKETGINYHTVTKINTQLNFRVNETVIKEKETPESIKDWEAYYLKQPTPKGCECPKLHTKRLNTYL